MAKKAQEKTDQIYKYPIESVFTVITESIIKQMQGPGKKNNLNLINPLGKESNYTIKQGTREVPIHFEVTKFDRPYHFAYNHAKGNGNTEIEWLLEDFDANTTKVTYIERAGDTSFLNYITKLFNKKRFKRMSSGYFYQIDAVLEKETKNVDEKPTTSTNETAKTATKKKTSTAKKGTTKKQTKKQEAIAYETMTVAELKSFAKENNIAIPSKTRKKADIIALLKKEAN